MPQIEDYYGKLSGKQIDNLPQDIGDLVSGKTSVGMARDLYSPTDIEQKNQSFIFRTTGGSDSIQRDGEARLQKIWGNYTKVSGKIKQTQVEKFRALGLNGFDRFSMCIPDCKVDSTGTIVAAPGKTLCYCRCAQVASGYTVFDGSSGIEYLGWTLTKPEEGSTGITALSFTASLGYVSTPAILYAVVVLSNPEYLCIHPKWSGYMDKTFAAYTESTINFSGLRLWSCGEYYDEINLETGAYITRVASMVFTQQNLDDLRNAHPSWVEGKEYIYDSDTIYYLGTETTQTITTSPIYYACDFSTEEFIPTEVPVKANLLYKANLVDKLRNDVVVKSDLLAIKAIFSDGTEKTYKIGKEDV